MHEVHVPLRSKLDMVVLQQQANVFTDGPHTEKPCQNLIEKDIFEKSIIYFK